jgi:hypothetical protein
MTDSLLPEHRERLYPPTLALSMFMGQVLSEDGSCQKAVDSWAAQRAAEGLSVQSVNTGAYCKARQRLPVEMVSTLSRHTAQQLSARAQPGWRWRGRCVKLVDGTGCALAHVALARLSPVETACKCVVSGNTVVPPCLASRTYFQGDFRGETWRNQLVLISMGGRFGLRSFWGFILARRRRFRAAVSGRGSIRFSIRASVNRDL